MERLSREELKKLTDREVKIAFERIKRDYNHGILNDKVTPLENARLLEEELRSRNCPEGN